MTARELANHAYRETHPIQWVLHGRTLVGPDVPHEGGYHVVVYAGPLGPWLPVVEIVPVGDPPTSPLTFQSLNPLGWPSDMLRFVLDEVASKANKKRIRLVRAILSRKDKP